MQATDASQLADSRRFAAACEAVLRAGARVRFRARGQSMQPNVLDGDVVEIATVEQAGVRRGDIALTRSGSRLLLHRAIRRDAKTGALVTRGDSAMADDASPDAVFGKLISIHRGNRKLPADTSAAKLIHSARKHARRLRRAIVLRVACLRPALPLLLLMLGVFAHAPAAQAQFGTGQFSIANSANPTSVAVGGTITYTQTITCTGGFFGTCYTPSGRNPVTITQTIPANTTYTGYSVAGTASTHWTCTPAAPVNAGGTLTCTDSNGGTSYANNGTTTITITVTVNAGTAGGTVVTDTATVNPGNSSDNATSTVTVSTGNVDLSMTQTESPNPIATGAQITYTETVTNNDGTYAASGATLSQNTPANTTFTSAAAPAGWTCGTVPAVGGTGTISCSTTGQINPGVVSGNFTIVVTVNASVPVNTNITNTATVTETGGTDPNLSNNTTATTTTISGADLSMTQSASATAVAAGTTITYTETVTNNGPDAAVNAVLYQKVPANTTFSSMTPPAGWTCTNNGTGQVTCTATGNVNSGVASGTFTYIVTVANGTAAGTTIVNSADVTSDTTDPVPSNNATTTSVLVESSTQWDLAVSMTAAPTPVFVSSQLTYSIQVQNLGIASAGTVTLTDALPATLVSPSGAVISGSGSCGAPSGGQIVCTLTALPATVTITGTTPATATTLQNTASVPTTGDSVPGNNSATVVTVVQPLVCATPGNDGAPGTPLSGIVNTYFAGSGSASAGATSITVATPSSGAATQFAAGDLALVIQMQAAQIYSVNSTSYGADQPGYPAGYTSLGNSGEFEFVTITNVTTGAGTETLTIVGTGANGGLLNSYAEVAASATHGAQTFQVIRVPQYASATLGSSLGALPWTGSVGGVLALDVASQLTLGGTVSLDGDGFRGGGGITLGGSTTGANTDTMTTSPANLPTLNPDPPAHSGANGSKGEGIAGTPHWVAPLLSSITPGGNVTALSTGQSYVEGLPTGSFGRGAPANAGGGATDADPAANDQNDGGGGGGNGGTGGNGGFAWSSANVVGGFGGVAFPANTGAVVMGGGGGAGTSNNGAWWDPTTNTGNADCGAACTGVFSSGTAGGGIVIIRAGSVTGTGTITANGLNALDLENDAGGGGGAGGSILVYANSGTLSGLTAIADGGNGGTTWPEVAATDPFPGNRHGPGGGGGGGVILGTAGIAGQALGGAPGTTTLSQDAYGATAGQPGIVVPQEIVTEAPGAQSGAYCAGADLAVTNSAAPTVVMVGQQIVYTQTVTNAGPQDAVNATLNEVVPANAAFYSISISGADATGWSCPATPPAGGTGSISCVNADVPSGANGTATFTVTVTVDPLTPSGTQISDTVSVASGANDPNLTNNSATAVVTVAGANTSDLSVTNTALPTVVQGKAITYTIVVSNGGPIGAVSPNLTDTFTCVPPGGGAEYNCITSIVTTPLPSGGWNGCTAPTGSPFTCSAATLGVSPPTTTFTFKLTVKSGTPAGTTVLDTATVSSSTTDPNPSNNSATSSVLVAANNSQADLAVTKTGTPATVYTGEKINYTVTVTNNGPASVAPVFTDTFSSSESAPAGNPCGTWTYSVSSTQFSCTDTAAMAPYTSAQFTFAMKVTGTAPGTVTNSVSVSPTASDPYLTNNTSSTTSTIASPTDADLAVVKTASPSTVEPGAPLVYNLQVTNNGPAISTNVTATDQLPTQVTYVSATSTQGSCSYNSSNTTVSCSLGNIGVGDLVLITINTTSENTGTPAAVTNTASVTCNTPCPDDPNTTSTVNSSIISPTAVQLDQFTAQMRAGGGVLIQWRTREETRNLGFHVYREDATGRHQLDPSLIAGSALFFRGGLPQHHGRTYAWIDPQGGSGASYWLEDVDLNGTITEHGPITPEGVSQERAAVAPARLLTQLNAAIVTPARVGPVHGPQTPIALPPSQLQGISLDGSAAVKISVSNEGWYQVTGAQLAAAGFATNVNARLLHLYAEGVEQPIVVLGNGSVFGPNDSIEFYGTGIDTPFSGTRVYWLTSGLGLGSRISSVESTGSGTPTATDFPFSLLFQQRTTYFAALLNGENNDNFFGAIITPTAIDQVLNVVHFDPNSSIPATLALTLQGVSLGQPHSVEVDLNGVPLGDMDFTGEANTTNTFPVTAGLLQNGSNTVTLTGLDGEYDVSLVQSIELTYAHTYSADSDWLRATAAAGATVRINGFTQSSVKVFDITDPTAIVQLNAPVTTDATGYGVTLAVDGPAGSQRTLLAFAGDEISAPDALAYHAPSTLASDTQGANYVVITYPDFSQSVEPLVKLHESKGESATVVTTDQIYDAFNYGEHSPFAIRDYLQLAATQWRVKPSAVLLVGGASLDPRNYLGFGDLDFVPTRLIQTAAFKTASDDWLTDFSQSGYATIPTGRLPVQTSDEAALVVSKIVNYESGAAAGSWQNQAVVIADQNIDVDFTSEANAAAAVLPPSLQVTKILADGQDPALVQPQILSALNNGALLVNYTGHGSEEEWSFEDLLDDTSATALTNDNKLPMYLLMDCLNGFFQDVYETSLSTSLMLSPNGGAVAVWASSGFTDAAPQGTMDQAFLSAWAANPQVPIGSDILAAKSGVTDPDVRRTWILFGDPDMRLQLPSTPQSMRSSSTRFVVRNPNLP